MKETKKQRYDKAEVLGFRKDADGYLTVTAGITRPGVFPYKRGDGALKWEAKLPEDIFSETTIESAKNRPVTDEHPPEPVNSRNWQKYARGTSHHDSRIDDDLMKVTMTVTDEGLIERIESGKQKEISIGFETDLDDTPGEWNGQRYDARQTNIRINHIAVTARGRAGPTVAIRGDSAVQVDEEDENTGGITMAKYKVDGKEFDVPSEIKSFLDAQEAKLDAATQKAQTVDSLQGRHDALEAEKTRLESELEEAKKQALTQDQLDAAIAARVELVAGAKTFLGDSADLTGKTDREIKLAVIEKAKGTEFKADGKSDDYINAFYDATVGSARKEGFSSTGTNQLRGGAFQSDSDLEDIEKLKAKRLNMGGSK